MHELYNQVKLSKWQAHFGYAQMLSNRAARAQFPWSCANTSGRCAAQTFEVNNNNSNNNNNRSWSHYLLDKVKSDIAQKPTAINKANEFVACVLWQHDKCVALHIIYSGKNKCKHKHRNDNKTEKCSKFSQTNKQTNKCRNAGGKPGGIKAAGRQGSRQDEIDTLNGNRQLLNA